MKKSAIVAIVEPLSFSLDRSLSWALSAALKRKKTFPVLSAASNASISLVGIIPVLQPIRASIASQSAFIIMVRTVFDAPDGFATKANDQFSLLDSDANVMGALTVNAARAAQAIMSLTLVSATLKNLDVTGVAALRAYMADLTRQLWSSEPINWTTHALHLASTGQFLSGREIKASGLTTGILSTNGGTVSIKEGIKPAGITYKGWRGSGTVTNISKSEGSDSYCTCGGGSSSGGDFGSGANSDGGGGYTGGNSFAAHGGSGGSGGSGGG